MTVPILDFIATQARAQGLTQNQLAQRADISPSLLSLNLSGKRPISKAVATALLNSLGVDPQIYDHDLQALTVKQPPVPRIPPLPLLTRNEQTKLLTRNEQTELLTSQLSRTMRIWSRMVPTIRRLDGDNWHIPAGTPTPDQIAEIMANRGRISSSYDSPAGYTMPLRAGLATLTFTKTGPGPCTISLQGPGTQDHPATWQFHASTEDTNTKQLAMLTLNHNRTPYSVPPGDYRVTAHCHPGTDWSLEWLQYPPGTGHCDINDTHRQPRPSWFPPGLHHIGPTAPSWTPLTVTAVQSRRHQMEACAFPLDGSKPIQMIDGLIGPRAVTRHSALDPDREYIIQVTAHVAWFMYFAPSQHPATD